MKKNLKKITNRKLIILTTISLFVGILMSCESPFEEVVTKDEAGNIKSKYTIRKEDGQKHGVYELYYDGELFEVGQFVDNKQDGIRTINYPTGEKQVEEVYANGNLTSLKTYFKDGTLQSEGQYDEEVSMSGVWNYYYDNGQLKEAVNFKNSVEDGAFKEYYKNGNIKAEGTYVPLELGIETEGVEQGELKEYNEQGVLITTKECVNGNCKTTWESNME